MAIKMNKDVALKVLFLIISLNSKCGNMLRFEKPVAEKIWKQPCNKHSRILNDCNWCRCTEQKRYTCDARVCGEVDMFGHFNDAIQDINVGMEGHGSWRTNQVACQPGVHYQRGELLCICTEDGNWPNPICRDTFRVLHQIEVVDDVETFKEQRCAPSKLYLIGCNVCYCPETGKPDPKYCTRKVCAEDDPIFKEPKEDNIESDVYAQCNLNNKYKLGCKTCVCLRNNRLLCDNCTNEVSHCSNKEPGDTFNIDCNTCQCNEKGLMFCTVKRCLPEPSRDIFTDFNLRPVDSPVNDLDCTPGTRYQKDCNTCYCYKRHGVKKFGCTLKKCSESDILNDCIEGTSYKLNCLHCQCGSFNGMKMQICEEDPICGKKTAKDFQELIDLHGYCEPLQRYKRDCNICTCMPDGKTVECTTNLCKKEPINVEIIPVMQEIGDCSKGSFKIDCNVCFCMSNGNVLCSTIDCSKKIY